MHFWDDSAVDYKYKKITITSAPNPQFHRDSHHCGHVESGQESSGLLVLLALNVRLVGESIFTVNILDTYGSQGESESLIGRINVSFLSILDIVFTLAPG